MEPLVISIGIFVIGFTIFLPLDKIVVSRNLHKLILFLNERDDYKVNSNIKSFKERFFSFSEMIYKKFNIKIRNEKYEVYKSKLILAGLNEKINVECFFGTKIVASIVSFLYFGLLAITNDSIMMYILIIVGGALAFYFPDNMLNIRIKKRQIELQRQLPSTLKTLAITTEAGLNFWEAIKKVCEVKRGILVDELKKTLDEVNMGVLQKDALMKLSERCKVTEITIFTFTIIQSLEKGAAGVTKALNEQATEVWEVRKNKAKEMGQKASIKLFLSMFAFVFPCLLIFLLGPAIMSVMKFFIAN